MAPDFVWVFKPTAREQPSVLQPRPDSLPTASCSRLRFAGRVGGWAWAKAANPSPGSRQDAEPGQCARPLPAPPTRRAAWRRSGLSGKADTMSQPGMTEKERGELQRNEDALRIPCSPHETSEGRIRTRNASQSRGVCGRGVLTKRGRRRTEIGARVGTRACSLPDLSTLDVSGEAGIGPPLSKDVRPALQRWRGRGRTTASVPPVRGRYSPSQLELFWKTAAEHRWWEHPQTSWSSRVNAGTKRRKI